MSKRAEPSAPLDRAHMVLQISPQSTVGVYPRALPVSREEFDELLAVLQGVAPTPNPHRPSTHILRKQCAFVLPDVVGEYHFGQTQDTLRMELDAMPNAVRRAFEIVRQCQADFPDRRYALAQANYYENGKVGVSPHADDEPFLNPTAPIYSFTFLEDEGATPRPFSIYKDGAKVLDVPLFHGDMLTMSGATQSEFTHGIEKDRPAKYGKRLNLTVRCVA